jgi:hypothetical protein
MFYYDFLLTMFGTMGTRLIRLEEQERGPTTSQPTRPRDSGHEIHSPRNLIDKSCKNRQVEIESRLGRTITDSNLSCKHYPLNI